MRNPPSPEDDPQTEVAKLKLKPEDQKVVDSIVGRETARTRFYRVLAIIAGIAGSLLAALAVVSLIFAISAKGDSHQSAKDSHENLGIVQRVTNPKAQVQQYTAFLDTETDLFRQDCKAKAQMLNLTDPAVSVADLAARCDSIHTPPVPVPPQP